MNPDSAGSFASHLESLLGADPATIEWPGEFTLAGGLPVVFDPHNALLMISGIRKGAFAGSELDPGATPGRGTLDLCSRVLVFAPAGEQESWANLGFVNEGNIVGYWSDGAEAQLWAKAWGERATVGSAGGRANDEPTKVPPQRRPALPRRWLCRPADPADAAEIGDLLRRVFPAYQTPEDPGSIRYALASGLVHGRLVREPAGKLAAYASVEFRTGGGAPEITDCATTPAARGKGLMTHLVARLQEDLADVFESRHCYCLAREDQPGMQKVLARRGWRRNGRLMNHYRVGQKWISAYLWGV